MKKKWLIYILLAVMLLASCQSGGKDKPPADDQKDPVEQTGEDTKDKTKDDTGDVKDDGPTTLPPSCKEISPKLLAIADKVPATAKLEDQSDRDYAYAFTKDEEVYLQFGEELYDPDAKEVPVKIDGIHYRLQADDPWLKELREAMGLEEKETVDGMKMIIPGTGTEKGLPPTVEQLLEDFPGTEGKEAGEDSFAYTIYDKDGNPLFMYNDDIYNENIGEGIQVVYKGKLYTLGQEHAGWLKEFRNQMAGFQAK